MILISYGTRPEYIKVKSLIDNMQNIKTLFTGQHTTLIHDHHPDYALEIKTFSGNRLNDIMCSILSHIEIFDNIKYVIVQGDTTSALAVALSAFHNNIKVIHLEAGLRTHDINDPYPEEMNRQLISRITYIHLCPTEFNVKNLNDEGITKNIYVTGNTGLDNINKDGCTYDDTVLITLHRRDNIKIMCEWFKQINIIANKYENIKFIFPMHPNPDIQKFKYILNEKNINVLEPLEYNEMIELMKKCKFIISDSGGIQEESSYLNKKVIVCRKFTERPETLNLTSILCDEPYKIPEIFDKVIENYKINVECPYGDGAAWKKVNEIIEKLQ